MAPPPPPHFPSSPGTQQVLQFLSTALSQRGPAALPYAEENKWLIRQHLVSLVETYHSLHPKASSFTHNDGRTVNLLQADGTIPIVYSGVVYNIPASIWLLERYPIISPSVFLNPTTDMVIKLNHPHVDRSGFVHSPYLKNWIYPSSNLVDLVRSLSQIFSSDPPLYSRQNHRPNPNPTPSPSFSPSPSLSSSSSGIHSISPYTPRPHARPTEDPSEEYRRNAMKKIVDAVHADSAALRKGQEAETEGLLGTQATLRQREEQIAQGLQDMAGEKEGLEQTLQVVLMNTDVLEGWVRENGGKWRGDVDAEDAFEPSDALSRQMLECTAADLAIEDTVYSLDKAVQSGAIPFDMYLKNVRALSREQFFHRALATKVRAAQVQSHVTNMAGRVPMHGS
ncbi:Protein ELC [Platanthera guangdongensis]|uniref:Protein ELC n=1 Tax=Platanthera guangdongensis TaxID=2320717 RepID=A0ABR2LPW1_9ASPA